MTCEEFIHHINKLLPQKHSSYFSKSYQQNHLFLSLESLHWPAGKLTLLDNFSLSSQRHISGREGMEHALLHHAGRPASIPRQQEHGYQRQRKSIADSKQRIRGIDPLRLRSWDKVIEFNATLTLLVLEGRNIFKWAQIRNMGEISRQSNLTHCVLALLIPWTRSFSVGGGDGWMCCSRRNRILSRIFCLYSQDDVTNLQV